VNILSNRNLLEVKELCVWFDTYQGTARAVEDVAFHISKGEVVGLVGETGCGKTVTSMAILGLVKPPGWIAKGRVIFEGEDLLQKTGKELRKIRGKGISMIFQEPMNSLNPVFRIDRQFLEILQLHQNLDRQAARRKMMQSFEDVGLPDKECIGRMYPHQLSGGMQQRVMIAIALACNSKLLIADEPTSALDVSTQLQFLQILRRIQQESGMSVLMISHDIGVVGSICERVYIMYAGSVVEGGQVTTIIDHPAHPYSVGLIGSVPVLGKKQETLRVIKGEVPNLLALPEGCRFCTRCPLAEGVCRETLPEAIEVEPGHLVRCHSARERVRAGSSLSEDRCVTGSIGSAPTGSST